MTILRVTNHYVRRRATRFGLMAAILLGVASLAQSAGAEPPVSTGIDADPQSKLPQVTVETRRQLERRVNEFVRQITNIPFSRQDSLPLWHEPLCFAVAGLPTEAGSYALGRLGEIARATGLRVARRGCKYNFIVIFSAEPDKLLGHAFHLHPREFNTDGGMTPLRNFIAPAKQQAVRAWHNTLVTTRSGEPIGSEGACATIAVSGMQVPVSCQYSPSRIERDDVSGFSLALIVIDTSYPKEYKLGQLIDYAAMVGLAEIPASEDLGDAPSVLRLFGESPDAQPDGLTAWDSAFLHALYHSDQGNTAQRSEIAVQMIHEVVR